MSELSFGNLDQVESQSYETIPADTYQLRAVSIDLVETKQGAGKAFKVEFSVVGGQYDDRKIFEMFNVVNSNAQAVEIALGSIKSWITATGGSASGELTASMVASLEGKTFMAKVGISKDKTGEYDDQNTIKRFLPPTSFQAPVAASSPEQAPTKKKAWEA